MEDRPSSPGARRETGPQFQNYVHSSSSGGSHHDGSSSGEGVRPKTFQLEFPCFDGEDSETWCCRAE
jgi:hypothetical protein